MAKLQAIIGPDGKPAHVNNRSIVAAEHVNYGVEWHQQAVEGFAQEHDPATGHHALSRYCKGAIYLTPRIDQQGTHIDIDPASCWGRETVGENSNLFWATGSYLDSSRSWSVTIYSEVELTRNAVLGLGSGGKGVQTEMTFQDPPTKMLQVMLRGYVIPNVGEAAWTRRLSILFYGEEP